MRTLGYFALFLLIGNPFTAPQALAQVQDPSPAAVALIIANSAYPDSDETLAAPLNEMKALADAARERGYMVEQTENVTKRNLSASIERFVANIQRGSTVMVFFAGYGVQVGGKNYVVPTDARIWNEQDVARDGVAVADILKRVEEKGAGPRVVLLDGARRNPFERRFRSYSAGLAPPTPASKDIVVLSIGPGSVLGEEPREGESFGSEMAKAMRKQGVTALHAIEEARNALEKRSDNRVVPAIFAGSEATFSFDPNVRVASTVSPPTNGRPGKASDKDGGLETTTRVEASPKAHETSTSQKDVSRKADVEKQLRGNPGDARALFDRGVLLAQNGDYGPALADFDRVVELDPGNYKALNNRCWLRALRNELQKAADDCDYLLKVFAETLDSRALVHLKLGEYAAAIEDYSEALRINAHFASSLYGRGIAKLRTGAKSEAEKDFKAALAVDPKIEQEYIRYGLR